MCFSLSGKLLALGKENGTLFNAGQDLFTDGDVSDLITTPWACLI